MKLQQYVCDRCEVCTPSMSTLGRLNAWCHERGWMITPNWQHCARCQGEWAEEIHHEYGEE